MQCAFADCFIPGCESRAGQRQALPVHQLAGIPVTFEIFERNGQRTFVTVGPEPGVEFVQRAEGGDVGHRACQQLRQFSEIGDGGQAIGCRAVFVVEIKDVEIRTIIHFTAAEFSDRQHCKSDRFSFFAEKFAAAFGSVL